MEFILLAFILLLGPVALWAGADSRPGVDDRRPWWPGVRGPGSSR